MTTITEVEAAAALAAEPVLTVVDPTEATGVALPPGWTWSEHTREKLAERPLRPRGTTRVHDAASFIAAVERRRVGGPEPMVYADEESLALVAILNDDEADITGWRDYRVELSLRRTPEWLHWKGSDGILRNQEAFAEHIEDGINELAEPDPVTMLELAQTFHAITNATMKSGRRLASGVVQLQYEEEVNATAGQAGEISIPEQLKLVVAPFYGGPRYEVTARFRYRLGRGDITMGYKLDRPHEVERAAFSDVRTKVDEDLPNAGMIAGPAPERPASI